MVLSTGTLVNRLSTSREAMVEFSSVGASRRISRKSVAELRQNLLGIYGVRSWLSFFAIAYVGVGICDMIGHSGLLGLCVFTFP